MVHFIQFRNQSAALFVQEKARLMSMLSHSLLTCDCVLCDRLGDKLVIALYFYLKLVIMIIVVMGAVILDAGLSQ